MDKDKVFYANDLAHIASRAIKENNRKMDASSDAFIYDLMPRLKELAEKGNEYAEIRNILSEEELNFVIVKLKSLGYAIEMQDISAERGDSIRIIWK